MDPIQLLNLRSLHDPLRKDFLKALEESLDLSDFIRGKSVAKFESEFAQFAGAPHCISVANGTDALTIVLRALELPNGTEVVTTANTFVATVEAIVNAGLKPKLVDVDPGTFLMTPESLKSGITDLTHAIIPVHLYGQMVEMSSISQIAKEKGLKIFEDAAQAHGAIDSKANTPGSCSSAATYSFFPGKNLGALGDGGAITTHDQNIANLCSKLRNHGGDVKYTHDIVGWNSRLDTLQAKFLSIKLQHLKSWNEKRRKVAERYLHELSSLEEITLPSTAPGNTHAYHLFVIQTNQRNELQNFLKTKGIETGIHYPKPIHLLPAFQYLGYRKGDFPVSEGTAEKILSLPMCPTLGEEEIELICTTVREFFRK